jgi:hypothetical protein
MRSIKELGWVLLEELLFGLGLVDITSRRSRNEYVARHTESYIR